MTIRNLAIIPIFAVALSGLTACGGGKSNDNSGSNATSTATSAAPAASSGAMTSGSTTESGGMTGGSATPPDCGAVKAVWVNTKTHVYHEPTDPMYGKTKHGEYMCPSAAKKAGNRPAKAG